MQEPTNRLRFFVYVVVFFFLCFLLYGADADKAIILAIVVALVLIITF